VVTEPQIDARSMKRVFANTQLPNFFTVGKHRQTHRTLAADFRRVRFFLILHSTTFSGRNTFHVMARELRCN
ncbi:hypothetical protein A2U01_0096314, partial [Trifolium medium]|nr:hypothetical protein [Trifolium medium]